MGEEKRKQKRVSSRIPVQFPDRDSAERVTMNVSRHGILVADPAEHKEGGLVRLRLMVPPQQRPVDILGRVAWRNEMDGMHVMGIHFISMDSKERANWNSFIGVIEGLEDTDAFTGDKKKAKPTPAPAAPAPDGERRRSERRQASFIVRFRDTARMEQFITENLSEGGMFLRTPVLKAVGDRIQVVVVHPVTNHDFELDAEVVHVNAASSDTEQKGMGLKFLPLDEEEKGKLERFTAGADK